MTAVQILERVSSLRPHPYGELLGDYLKSLECRIQTELLFDPDPIYNPDMLVLSDTRLEIYELYLFSIIDLLNGEYGRYENSSSVFNRSYANLCKKAMEQRKNPERSLKIWSK